MSNVVKLNCLVVDDEPLARKGLAEYVAEVDFLHLAGTCENALKAAALLSTEEIDLILLDIHMPKISGVEFLKTLRNPPLVIFTTAYSEYALEGYALDIMDYLVKPISFDRFLKAVQKARDYHELKRKPLATPDYFFIKCDKVFEKVRYSEVLYAEGMQNYCIIHTAERKLIAYITLTGLEQQLPKDRFLRVHKSFIISIEKVKSLDGSEVHIGQSRIPISRVLKDSVTQIILGSNLFKR